MSPAGVELFRWFREHGWTVSEVGMVEPDGQTTWAVTARQHAEVVFAKANTQAEAWAKAVRLVACLGDGQPTAESGPPLPGH